MQSKASSDLGTCNLEQLEKEITHRGKMKTNIIIYYYHIFPQTTRIKHSVVDFVKHNKNYNIKTLQTRDRIKIKRLYVV